MAGSVETDGGTTGGGIPGGWRLKHRRLDHQLSYIPQLCGRVGRGGEGPGGAQPRRAMSGPAAAEPRRPAPQERSSPGEVWLWTTFGLAAPGQPVPGRPWSGRPASRWTRQPACWFYWVVPISRGPQRAQPSTLLQHMQDLSIYIGYTYGGTPIYSI